MKVISLINMKGGVAKTTLAVNIADCLYQRHGKKVLLIDVDPQFNATQCLMSGNEYFNYLKDGEDTVLNIFDRNIRPTISFTEGVNKRVPKNLDEIKPYQTRRGFQLLPGALDLYKLEMAPGQGREFRIKNFLTTLGNSYEYVIIDTPPTPSVWMTSALLASQYYLIPVKPDPISLTGIDLLNGIVTEKMENFGNKIACAGVVLTVAEENTYVFRDARRNLARSEVWKDKIFIKSLPKRVEVARRQLKQEFILDIDDSLLKSNLVGIVKELIERIG
ncbi:AAA family ATPase [Paenibacillus sp. LMG 31456]|uniref:AAA family ATPase n=1 Tax=Paenibacillus foliorum TaxID=2654974 RepID=A0A972GZA6_9BACL|nr:ParA family protein [Paenibacillus foliorum]NOU95625.1 AAA family ATPase [Paenibacillus foliorum]